MKLVGEQVIGLLIAIFLALGGLALIVFPQDMMVGHAGNSRTPQFRSYHMTPGISRVCGGISIVLGLGLLVASVYTPKKFR